MTSSGIPHRQNKIQEFSGDVGTRDNEADSRRTVLWVICWNGDAQQPAPRRDGPSRRRGGGRKREVDNFGRGGPVVEHEAEVDVWRRRRLGDLVLAGEDVEIEIRVPNGDSPVLFARWRLTVDRQRLQPAVVAQN